MILPSPHTRLLQGGISWEWLQDANKLFRTQDLMDITRPYEPLSQSLGVMLPKLNIQLFIYLFSVLNSKSDKMGYRSDLM